MFNEKYEISAPETKAEKVSRIIIKIKINKFSN